jgi:hypothetical protein
VHKDQAENGPAADPVPSGQLVSTDSPLQGRGAGHQGHHQSHPVSGKQAGHVCRQGSPIATIRKPAVTYRLLLSYVAARTYARCLGALLLL